MEKIQQEREVKINLRESIHGGNKSSLKEAIKAAQILGLEDEVKAATDALSTLEKVFGPIS